MKSRIFIMPIILFLFFVINSNGQYSTSLACEMKGKILTGNLHADMMENLYNKLINSDGAIITEENKKYSPLMAGLFSAIIPGTGQFYTKSYWQSAAFLGAEVLSWILYASYENKGDRQTELFQKYANENWSVVRYSRWIETYGSQYYGISASDLIVGSVPNDISKPWNYVDWKKLNEIEEKIGGVQHSGFSHKLAPYGDQQYYEMIGKYAQFGSGWNDVTNFTDVDIRTENVTQNFLKYRDMRGEANSFYNIAVTVSYVIVANHIFSALEAAWNASKINNRIALEGHIQSRNIYGNMVEFVPTVNIKYEF